MPDVAPDPASHPRPQPGTTAERDLCGRARRRRGPAAAAADRDTPKALCPVGNVPLLDRALAAVGVARLRRPGRGRGQRLVPGRPDRPRRRFARPRVAWRPATHRWAAPAVSARSTTGSPGATCWSATRTPTSTAATSTPLLDEWDGDHVRILGVPAGRRRPSSARTASPGSACSRPTASAALPAEPGDLVRAVWRPAEAAGELRVVDYGGTYIDSGTAADYLAANLHEARRAAGGSLIDETAAVSGRRRTRSSVPAPSCPGRSTVRSCGPAASSRRASGCTDAIRYGGGETVHAVRPRRPDEQHRTRDAAHRRLA